LTRLGRRPDARKDRDAAERPAEQEGAVCEGDENNRRAKRAVAGYALTKFSQNLDK